MLKASKGYIVSFIIIGIMSGVVLGWVIHEQPFWNMDQAESPAAEDEGTDPEHRGSNMAPDEEGEEDGTESDSVTDLEELIGDDYSLSIYEQNDSFWIRADELAEETEGHFEWDEINGVIDMHLFDIEFMLVKEVPVVERNGLYLPYELEPLIEGEAVYLPLDLLEKGLEVKLEVHLEEEEVSFTVDPEVEQVFADLHREEFALKELGVDDLIDHLSFLTHPIPGAQISTRESHLPGAERAYRNGYHEGIDWYSGTSGTEISLDTPVQSVADGIVVRADWDYVEYEADEREDDLLLSAELSDTPAYILDRLRGRSVWVQYDQGVMIRYAHLSAIEEGIEVGQSVEQGETLGYVGNSGTSHAVEGDETGGLHLHADVLIYGELFWTYIQDAEDTREVLEHVFQD